MSVELFGLTIHRDIPEEVIVRVEEYGLLATGAMISVSWVAMMMVREEETGNLPKGNDEVDAN